MIRNMFLYLVIIVGLSSNVQPAAITPGVRSTPQEAQIFCASLFQNDKFAPCRAITSLGQILESACSWNYLSCPDEDPTVCGCNIAGEFAAYCVTVGITELVKWRDVDFCPLKCTGGRVHTSCAPSEERTCELPNFDDDACLERCYCPAGQVLLNDECILHDLCPCEYDGIGYPGGVTIQQGCNSCLCNRGSWECIEYPCDVTCSAVGDPHYTSFDGKYYDFMGNCSYYLVKACDFEVIGENAGWHGGSYMPYQPGMATCTRSVTIITLGYEIKIDQNRAVTVNGVPITVLPYTIVGITIYNPSATFVAVSLPNGVVVQYDGIYRAHVTVPRSLRLRTKGLCGNYNDLMDDDFMKPDGVVTPSINEFGNSWKTDENCGDIDEPVNPCTANPGNQAAAEAACGVILSTTFAACHPVVIAQQYYVNCVYDTCTCENDLAPCLCSMVAEYADVCRSRGIVIDWRSDVEECPMSCSGGQVYQVCAENCRRTCRDISDNFNCNNVCVEDCRCPEGQVLDGTGTCIAVETCNCVLDNQEYPAGTELIRSGQICTCENARWTCTQECDVENEVYYEDCNSCICENDLWSCTNIDCPTDGCIVRQSNGTHPQIFITVGEVWSEEPCTKCTCASQPTGYHLTCITEECPVVSLDTVNYVYQNTQTPDQCCPQYVRVACKYGGNEYPEGGSWTVDLCTLGRCVVNAQGVLTKRQYVTNCNRNCEEGYEYEESTTACCGKCVQYACIVDGGIRLVGESWDSEDGCITYTCEKINGDLYVFSDEMC